MLNLKSQKNSKKNQAGFSQNPKILEVNLIRDEMPVSFELKKHIGTLFFTLLVTVLFVAEVYIGLNWWSTYENARLEKSQNRFNTVSEEIRQMKSASDQVSSFKERVELADSLLNRHIYWSNFFTWLEGNTLSSVSYQGFDGTIDGEYELAAVTNAFRDLSWQSRVLLADPLVISARVDSGSGGISDKEEEAKEVGEISFSLSLKVNPDIFTTQGLDK